MCARTGASLNSMSRSFIRISLESIRYIPDNLESKPVPQPTLKNREIILRNGAVELCGGDVV